MISIYRIDFKRFEFEIMITNVENSKHVFISFVQRNEINRERLDTLKEGSVPVFPKFFLDPNYTNNTNRTNKSLECNIDLRTQFAPKFVWKVLDDLHSSDNFPISLRLDLPRKQKRI